MAKVAVRIVYGTIIVRNDADIEAYLENLPSEKVHPWTRRKAEAQPWKLGAQYSDTVLSPGDEFELESSEASRLIESGVAILINN